MPNYDTCEMARCSRGSNSSGAHSSMGDVGWVLGSFNVRALEARMWRDEINN